MSTSEQSIQDDKHIVTFDRDLRVVESEGDLFVAKGLAPHANIGDSIEVVLEKLWNKELTQYAGLVIEEGKSFSKTITLNPRAHHPLTVHISFEPRVEKGMITGLVLTGKNISESTRIKNQETLRDKMLNLSILAAQIADKLNNPLASVLNRVGYLLVEDLDSLGTTKLKSELSAISDQLFSMSLTTNALQSFSKDTLIQRDFININDIISKTVDLSKFLKIQGNVSYNINFGKDLPLITGCEITLEQAFLNIVQNSLEAMPNGGTLGITTAFDKISRRYVNVEISDTGVGIPPENIDRIFDPFFKTKGHKHTGLGLSISYGIIMNHKGSMEVRSDLNKGTTISVLLPIYDDNNKVG